MAPPTVRSAASAAALIATLLSGTAAHAYPEAPPRTPPAAKYAASSTGDTATRTQLTQWTERQLQALTKRVTNKAVQFETQLQVGSAIDLALRGVRNPDGSIAASYSHGTTKTPEYTLACDAQGQCWTRTIGKRWNPVPAEDISITSPTASTLLKQIPKRATVTIDQRTKTATAKWSRTDDETGARTNHTVELRFTRTGYQRVHLESTGTDTTVEKSAQSTTKPGETPKVSNATKQPGDPVRLTILGAGAYPE